MRKILFSILVLCLPVLGFAYDDGDWQYWNTEGIKGDLTEKLGASLDVDFRWGDNASEYYYQATQLGLGYEVCDWFEIGPAYRETFTLDTKTKTEDDWFSEHRPMLNGTIKWKWADWKFSDRARIEYRMFDIDKDDVWRFRNQITLKSPWKWTGLGINPYISDEIFIQEDSDGINRNRVFVGVSLKLFEHVQGEVYYLWQTDDTGDEWKDTNVIGTKLQAVF